MDDGTEVVMAPGDMFYVPPGHDSWVVGDEPYVSIHFMGADDYAADYTLWVNPMNLWAALPSSTAASSSPTAASRPP